VLMVYLVLTVATVLMVLMVPRETPAELDPRENPDKMDHPEVLELREIEDPRELLMMDPRESLVSPELTAYPDPLALRVPKVTMVMMEMTELTVFPESPGLRELLVRADPRDLLDEQEHPDPMESQVYPELTDSPDLMETREPRETEVTKVPPVSESPEMMEKMVVMVLRELRERWECLEPLD